MKTLLRSTFTVRPEDNAELFLRNVQALRDSNLKFEVVEDATVWNFIQDFTAQHHHVPTYVTLQENFKYLREIEVVDRLDQLSILPPRTQGNFLALMEEKVKDYRTRQTVEILKEAARIVEVGITIKGERGKETHLQGSIDAIRYIMDRGHEIVTPTSGARLSGNVIQDGQDFKEEYERVEADPLAGIGQYTGIAQLDNSIHGSKRGELWLHAAYTGQLKSTFAINWVYNQAIWYKHSCVYFSLEMPYTQVRRKIMAIHSGHEKFDAIRKSLGIGRCLAYSRIRDGRLDEYTDDEMVRLPPEQQKRLVDKRHPDRPEKKFLEEHVIPDLENPLNEYGSLHIEVADPDKSDFTISDLRSKAELLYSKDPAIRMLIVDHAGLMSPRHRHQSTTENLNEVLRDLKRMAMSFNRGLGIGVVSLFQISREGFKSAEKNDGRYNLTHLSYANEAERCVLSTSIIRENLKGYIKVCGVREGDRVLSSGGWKRVLNRFDNGVRRIWKVTTDRGSMLEATASHRVRVIADGHLGWKLVQNLTPEDFVAGVYGGEMPSKWPPLPALEFRQYERRRDRSGEEIRVPCQMNPDLAYLMGAWDGDGAIHPDGIGFTGNRLEVGVRDNLLSKIGTLFSHQIRLDESPSRPGSFDIRKFSRPLKRWFESLAGPRGLSVPEVILQSPEEGVRAYLRGLFDTDGWFNKVGIVGISMKGAAEGFLRDVQMLLTGLGIDSHLSFCNPLSKQTGKRYPKVSLRVRSRRGVQVFAEKIGFTDNARQERLLKWIQTRRIGSRRGDVQVYPVPETFTRVYQLAHPPGTAQNRFERAFYNLPARVKRTGRVPIGAVETLLAAAKEDGIDNADTTFLRSLLNLQVMQVVSVEDTGRDEPVVDLEVEGDHEYQTGPILSHNSSDVVTSTFLDKSLSERNLVRFQCLKTRDDQPFDSFFAGITWLNQRMFTTHDVSAEDARKAGETIDSDNMLSDDA